jgi:alkylated DNA repair dioxygenase AlkB
LRRRASIYRGKASSHACTKRRYGGPVTPAYQPSMLDLIESATASPTTATTATATTATAAATSGATAARRVGAGAAGDAALEPLAGRVVRHELTAGARIDVLPGWVRGSDTVFQTLLTAVDWRAERRTMYDGVVDVPRLLRWYAGHETLPHPVLTLARQALTDHYVAELGEPFVTAGMCLYRDGRDSVAWHGDTKGRSAHADTMVAIVSFGSPRNLLLRPRPIAAALRDPAGSELSVPGRDGGRSATLRFPLGHGDLIVMGGSCQRTWEHSVPKTARPVGPRISVQFRPSGVA